MRMQVARHLAMLLYCVGLGVALGQMGGIVVTVLFWVIIAAVMLILAYEIAQDVRAWRARQGSDGNA